MSDDLTDELLAHLADPELPMPPRECIVDCIRAMAAELRRRRAVDLSAEDLEWLRLAREDLAHDCQGRIGSIDVIDRLIAARKP